MGNDISCYFFFFSYLKTQISIKFLAFDKNLRFLWCHVIYVTYNYITFHTGFERSSKHFSSKDCEQLKKSIKVVLENCSVLALD